MDKIIFEDLTDSKAVRNQYVEKLADSLYQNAAQIGLALGMNLEEVVAAMLLTACDVRVYSKAVGLIDETVFAELETRASELAEARCKRLDEGGVLDTCRKFVAEMHKKRDDGDA